MTKRTKERKHGKIAPKVAWLWNMIQI